MRHDWARQEKKPGMEVLLEPARVALMAALLACIITASRIT